MTVENSAGDNAGLTSTNPTSPAEVDVEREPMPDHTSDASSDRPSVPPARSGTAAEASEKPTEAGAVGNPVHHTGHVPPPVTSNKE
jgi:hypothetical protein